MNIESLLSEHLPEIPEISYEQSQKAPLFERTAENLPGYGKTDRASSPVIRAHLPE